MDSKEQAIADSTRGAYDYMPDVFREFFTTPFEQYSDRIGQRFTVLHRLPNAEPDCEGDEGEEMYRIRFEDGTEIDAWGLEVCVLVRPERRMAVNPHDHEACGCRYLGSNMWDCGTIDGDTY